MTPPAPGSAGATDARSVTPGVGARTLDLVGIVVLCACAVLAGLLELLLVPLYVGGTLVPVAVVAAVASNIALPRMARALFDRTVAAAAPFLAWLVTVTVVGLMPRPEGDVVLPGGGSLQLVSYGVLLGGAVAGTLTVVIGSTPPLPPAAGRAPRR